MKRKHDAALLELRKKARPKHTIKPLPGVWALTAGVTIPNERRADVVTAKSFVIYAGGIYTESPDNNQERTAGARKSPMFLILTRLEH